MWQWSKPFYLFIMLVLIFSLSACSDADKKTPNNRKTSKAQSEAAHVSLELEQSQFPYENWKMDNTHQKLVKGRLLANNKPIVGAVIQVSNKRKTVTDENGAYSLLLNTNIIEKDIVHVASVNKATVGGKALNKQMKEKLLALQQEITVYFPIAVEKVETNKKNANLVDVHAHAVLAENETFPKFGVEKFPIIGTIKDANGNPVAGATVNIRRDGVEGFSMSEPSNEEGEYAMYYIPEDDEGVYLNVYIPSKDITYTLPENKTFYFPDDFGIKLNIVLPEKGTVIEDKPPTLVATNAQGALYKGILIGLHTPTGTDYSITIPKQDGTFVATLPKEVWENNPSWYEVNYHDYSKKELNLGDTLTSDLIPLPRETEPNHIVTVNTYSN